MAFRRVREPPRPLEVLEEAPRLGRREADHRVEPLLLRDVRRDVEAAREVVHRHGRDARHEDAVARALELLEPAPVEARAVRDLLVGDLPRRRDDLVREVVVLVDDHIDAEAEQARGRHDGRELLGRARTMPDRLDVGHVADKRLMLRDERIQLLIHVRAELVRPRFPRADVHLREIERENEVPARVCRRIPPDVEPAEEPVEVPLLRDVVVAAQRLAEERLPEPARPHEEEEVRARLQPADERRLVDVVEVLQADALEVLHAVGYLLGPHAEIIAYSAHRPARGREVRGHAVRRPT